MKNKGLRCLTLLLCLLLLLPSCDTTTPQESDTERETKSTENEAISTEKETEKQTERQTEKETEKETEPEWAQMEYWDVGDQDPDLENVDYSKLMFCTDIVTYSNDLELKVSKLSDVRTMKELVEAKESEWKKVTSYDEGLALLKEIIADSQNQECALMVIVEYTSEDGPWVFSVNNHYKARHELEYSNGEKKLIWFYSKEWIESGFTPSPEKLMETFERYTMYSDFSRIVISAVPIPAE